MFPSVYISPLKLHLATKINLHRVSDSALSRNHLIVCLSPLKSPVLRNSRSKYNRSVVYLSMTKCNAKRCSCCKHLYCKSTIKSNVNGRQFSVITNSDLDWKSTDVIYVLSWEEKDCGMQYVGQVCRFLKTRFSEHYPWTLKPRKIYNFFIGISNKLITILAVFLFSLSKRLHIVIIPLKDIEIFLGMN